VRKSVQATYEQDKDGSPSPTWMLVPPCQKLDILPVSLARFILGVSAMTTPHARPGFVSRNTEGDPDASHASKEKAFGSIEHGLDSDVSKTGVDVDIQDGELHHGQGDDGFAEMNAPVETAADLVTQVIHLDDDPTEQSLTFRTWFLGKRSTQKCLFNPLTGVSKVLGSQSSHLCCRKSSTSSLRRFLCLWSS
jgi:hypothetical protein